MPRFYFDIHDENGLISDEEGTELPDMDAARIEAVNSLSDITRDAAIKRRLQPLAIEVLDENRRPVFRAAVEFSTNSAAGSRSRH